MGENILPDLGIQHALAGNQGIYRTEQYPHVFTTELWGQALQKHPLHMRLFFVWEERDIPRHHCDGNDCLEAMWFTIECS